MRKSKPKKRILLPDPKFHDVMVTRFVNNLMLQGKKSIAYSIFYDAIDMVGEKMKDSDKAPLDIWRKALENITPQVEVKSRGQEPQNRWSELPGADRGASGKENFTLHEEYDSLRPQAFRPLHGRKTLCRNHRCIQLRGCGIQEKRRHAQDGRGQQGICTFPFLIPN